MKVAQSWRCWVGDAAEPGYYLVLLFRGTQKHELPIPKWVIWGLVWVVSLAFILWSLLDALSAWQELGAVVRWALGGRV